MDNNLNNVPNNGMPNNGVPNNGMPNNGMPNNAMPNNGMPYNGMPNNGMPNNNVYVQPAVYAAPPIPEEYKPISMWGYFGYEILFTIPCIGFILLLIFSFGGTKNLNVRNFARSYFCFLIIVAVVALLLIATGALAAFS